MFFFLFRNKCSALSRSPIFKWWQQSRARIRTKRLSSVWLQPQAIFVDPAPCTWFLNVAPIWQITSWILRFYWNVNETAWTKTLSSRKLEIRLVKLLIRKGVERWFFSLNTNNLAFTVLRSTASLFSTLFTAELWTSHQLHLHIYCPIAKVTKEENLHFEDKWDITGLFKWLNALKQVPLRAFSTTHRWNDTSY